ncbi:MAG: hypothetical protein ACYC6G_17215 [Desulfobaccales bacterium]
MRLVVPFTPRVKGGGVVTAVADYPGQGIFWQLVGVDWEAGEEVSPYGSLRFDFTRADNSGLSTNIYSGPTDPVHAGKTDRIKLRWADGS